ncbi:MAG: LacI family DNA-binding transcriptional regulator [Candidatus Dormiibacterota bacterium]
MDGNGSRPTIYDVARLAGVSAKTVSRVVNSENSVREETRERVRRAITMLGFQPHPLASALRRGRTLGIVGLVIQDLHNPFYLALAGTIETTLRNQSFTLMVASASENAVLERTLVDAFLRRGISGLIVAAAPGGDHSYLTGAMENGVGVVFVDRAPIGLSADWVTIDNERGGYLATQYLIQQGHQRIMAIGGPGDAEPIQARVRGYQRALRESNEPDDPTLIELEAPDAESAASAVRHLMQTEPAPTAVFTLNNRSCLGAVAELVRRPEQIAVATFGAPEGAELFQIPVARVRYDAVALAETAAQYLLERIDGSREASRQSVIPVSMEPLGSAEEGQQPILQSEAP